MQQTPTPIQIALSFLNDLVKLRSQDITYNINLPSLRITMNTETEEPEKVICESTNDASHSIVAVAMVLANLIVSKHLATHSLRLPNRFHDKIRGINIPDFEKTFNEHVDSYIIVKRFSRACYSIDNKGHFGLGISDYVHFTSPMRRYADIIVHLLLAGISMPNLENEVKNINQAQLTNRSLQDLYKHWKIVRWIKNTPRKTYDAWVTWITPSGLLWYIPEISQNGFAHVSELEPKQRWSFECGEKPALIGPTHSFKFGQKVKATVSNIDSNTFIVKVLIQTTESNSNKKN